MCYTATRSLVILCEHSEEKEDKDNKGKSKTKKKELTSMFQINGEKSSTKGKKKGN